MPDAKLPKGAYAALEALQAQAVAVTAAIPGNDPEAVALSRKALADAQAQMAKHPSWVAKIIKALMKDPFDVTVLTADADWLAQTFAERVAQWPPEETMTAQCPNCETPATVDIVNVRAWDMTWRPVDCDTCFAEFELSADGSTALMLAPASQSMLRSCGLLNKTLVFDPDGCKNAPYTTAVEILLGGVGRLMFPDGTEQFVDDDAEPALIYSPRLQPEALERFCAEHMERYERFHEEHEAQLAGFERVAMDAFW
ncbi:hypothetical protein [Pseudomonas cannabina]|uniref:GNAT acetyltransferase n=1 Tax=Pseudomonas cannabina TaxID=86840 RepID=A0A0P9QFM2_PSECA|nr:hypothetical protein [Pseudomonas cannabina]KAA8698865.1 hypothetical protein F4W70_27395 [Pseudomonas cannabina]KPW69339.1 hypothetical protein ALO81_200024 [Pseudomonas cannabina]RMN36812.1 hypothetical protein ALQ64_01902 [Pseudomonas cannabina]SDR54102.1 hypothetical protein SAMN05216597_5632 [Pseudomonas cannabina]